MSRKKIERVLFICPPAVAVKGVRKICQIPLGLLYLASSIKNDYEVKILDAVAEGYENEHTASGDLIVYGLSFLDIRTEIEKFNPDVVGISMQSTAFFLNGLAIAKLAKYVRKDVIVIVGGAYPSSNPEETIEHRNIDYAILGEGEQSLKQLLRVLNDEGDASAIDGIAYRTQSGSAVIKPRQQFIEDLDSLPFPDLRMVKRDKYFAIHDAHFETQTNRATHMITSRGCPNDCNFCTIHDVWGYKFRPRSARNVIDEVERLVGDFGIQEIHFEDDNLAYDHTRAVELFRMLRPFNLQWALPNGISIRTLSNDLLKQMRECGCFSMAMPFESGSPVTLQRIIKKQVDLDYGRAMCATANKLGIETYGFFVVGFPGETLNDIKATLDFSTSLDLTGIYIFYATPFPGTKLLQQIKELGYLPENFDAHRLTIAKPTFGTDSFTAQELHHEVSSYIERLSKDGHRFL